MLACTEAFGGAEAEADTRPARLTKRVVVVESFMVVTSDFGYKVERLSGGGGWEGYQKLDWWYHIYIEGRSKRVISRADRAVRRRVSCLSMTCFHYLRRTSGVFHAWFHVVRQTYADLDKGSKQYGVS